MAVLSLSLHKYGHFPRRRVTTLAPFGDTQIKRANLFSHGKDIDPKKPEQLLSFRRAAPLEVLVMFVSLVDPRQR